jgi:hypothetical protein
MIRRISTTWIVVAGIFLGIALCISIWVVFSPKAYATFLYDDVSPDQRFRLETWQAFYFTSIDHGFVMLYDNKTGAFLGESDVVHLTGNAEIFWPLGVDQTVGVGVDIRLRIPPAYR